MVQTNEDFREYESEPMLPAIADKTLVAIAEEAEKRVEAMNKIKRMALKLTNPRDWVDENGRPYLQASGSEKVARLYGISWRINEPTLDNLEGGHYMYTYTGIFSLAGASIDVVGTRSSKDPFFKKYKYEGEDDNRKRTELPPSEIDRGDVKKSAYSNLLANGVTRLLGIRNLTYDDLKEYAGITKDQVTSVEYKKSSKVTGSSQSTPRTVLDPNAPASEPQVKAIHAMLGKINITDDMAKCEKVRVILSLNEVPTSISKLTKVQASTVIESLQGEVNDDNRKGN